MNVKRSRETGLRERLLANEKWDSPLRDRYEAEIQALLLESLSPLRRWSFVAVSVMLTGFSGLTGWLAITMTELPALARLLLLEGTVLQLIAVIYCVHVLRKGAFHRRRDPTFQAGFMWCFSVLLAVHFLMLMAEVRQAWISILFLGVVLVTMIGAGVQLLRTCIEQSELNTHERLLETVLRLTPTVDDEPKPGA